MFCPLKAASLPFELVGSFVVGHRETLIIMEDITKFWNNLSLNDREGSALTLPNKLKSSEFLIAAKFLTRRALNIEAVARTFNQLWRSTSGFKIRNLDDHIIVFVS